MKKKFGCCGRRPSPPRADRGERERKRERNFGEIQGFNTVCVWSFARQPFCGALRGAYCFSPAKSPAKRTEQLSHFLAFTEYLPPTPHLFLRALCLICIPQVLLPHRAPLPARFPGHMQTLATTEQTNIIVPIFAISQVSQVAIISSLLLKSVHALFRKVSPFWRPRELCNRFNERENVY